jgi:hypothetical protein
MRYYTRQFSYVGDGGIAHVDSDTGTRSCWTAR